MVEDKSEDSIVPDQKPERLVVCIDLGEKSPDGQSTAEVVGAYLKAFEPRVKALENAILAHTKPNSVGTKLDPKVSKDLLWQDFFDWSAVDSHINHIRLDAYGNFICSRFPLFITGNTWEPLMGSKHYLGDRKTEDTEDGGFWFISRLILSRDDLEPGSFFYKIVWDNVPNFYRYFTMGLGNRVKYFEKSPHCVAVQSQYTSKLTPSWMGTFDKAMETGTGLWRYLGWDRPEEDKYDFFDSVNTIGPKSTLKPLEAANSPLWNE